MPAYELFCMHVYVCVCFFFSSSPFMYKIFFIINILNLIKKKLLWQFIRNALKLMGAGLSLNLRSIRLYYLPYHWVHRWTVAGIPLHQNNLHALRIMPSMLHSTNNPLHKLKASSKLDLHARNCQRKRPKHGRKLVSKYYF